MNSRLWYYWAFWRLLLNKSTNVTYQNVLLFATLQYVKWQVTKNKNAPQGMISTHCTWPWLSQSLETFLGLNHEKNQALLLVWDDFPDLRQPLLYALLLSFTLVIKQSRNQHSQSGPITLWNRLNGRDTWLELI